MAMAMAYIQGRKKNIFRLKADDNGTTDFRPLTGMAFWGEICFILGNPGGERERKHNM